MSAVAYRAVLEKVTKGRAGIGWDSVVEKTGYRGNQEDIMSAQKFGRHTTEVEENVERREELALRKKSKLEKHLRAGKGKM